MNHFPQGWHRPRDDVYGSYDSSYIQPAGVAGPNTHTQQPVVTGTSVLAAKFKDGVVIAADNLASYGSLARFTDVKRLIPFNDTAVVGIGGDVSDMQYLTRLLLDLSIDENYDAFSSTTTDDDSSPSASAHGLDARNLHKYLSKVFYQRRSRIDPLWNACLVAGTERRPGGNTVPFLAAVDLLGTTYSSPTLATGFGAHLAQPLLRKLCADEAGVKDVTRAQAEKAVRDALKVLFYRDARSMDHFSLAVITADGIELSEDEKLEEQSWAFADRIRGYGTQTN